MPPLPKEPTVSAGTLVTAVDRYRNVKAVPISVVMIDGGASFNPIKPCVKKPNSLGCHTAKLP
jgi:hypothetical protein